MRGILKASAIVNFGIAGFVSLFTLLITPFFYYGGGISFIFAFLLGEIIFMFVTGGVCWYYSKLEMERLYQKKDIILILAILSLFSNFVASILLFIARDQITTQYRIAKKDGTLKKIKPKKVNPETQRLDILLKIGVALVCLSGLIFATNSWSIIDDSVKVASLLIMSIFFISLSIFSERKLKLQQSTIMYWILGIIFIILTGIAIGYFGILGNWFSFIGDGQYLYLAALTFITTVLTGITYKKFPDKIYLYAMAIGTIVTLGFIFAYAKASFITIIIILSLLITLINVMKQPKTEIGEVVENSNMLLTFALTFTLLLYLLITVNSIFTTCLACLILSGNLMYYMYNKNNELLSILVPFIITLLIGAGVIGLGLNGVVSVLIASVVYTNLYLVLMLTGYLYKEQSIEASFTVMLNLAMLIVFITSLAISPSMPILVGFLLLLPAIINKTMMKNRSKIEHLLVSIKILMFTIAIIYLMVEAIAISTLFALCICFLALLLAYFFTTEKYLKIIYFMSFGIVLIIALSSLTSTSETIPALIVLLSAIFPFMITSKNKDPFYKNLSLASLIVLLVAIYHVIVATGILGSFQNLSVFIVMFIYLIMLLANQKKKEYFLTVSVAMIIPFWGLINSDICHYPFGMILSTALAFYVLYLLVANLTKKDSTKSVLYTIFSCLILLTVVFEANLIVGIFVGIVTLILMVIGILNDNYKGLFITGLIFLILSLIVQLHNLWTQIPFWLYLLIAGLGMIGFATFKELEKKK